MEEIVRGANGDVVHLPTDNSNTQLPVFRWLVGKGVHFNERPRYCPDFRAYMVSD